MPVQSTAAEANFTQPYPFFQLPPWQLAFPKKESAFLERQSRQATPETAEVDQTSLAARSDFELIDSTLEGNHHAFDVLVKRYSGSIYALAYRMLQNHDDAADISQDVFLKAYEALNSFRKKSSFHLVV